MAEISERWTRPGNNVQEPVLGLRELNMTKYRVNWKENGKPFSKMFAPHQEKSAKEWYAILQRDTRNPRIITKISDIKFTEISDSQVWEPTYHTPIRSHRKGLSKSTDRIKR